MAVTAQVPGQKLISHYCRRAHNCDLRHWVGFDKMADTALVVLFGWGLVRWSLPVLPQIIMHQR
jgi:hypothetical protein